MTAPKKALADLRARARKAAPAAIITDLARMLPELRHAPGLEPWEPESLHGWALNQEEGGMVEEPGAMAATRFILSVWSGTREAPWDIGPFHLVDLRDLCPTSRGIIAAWVTDPFWL
jgi:hypothetical protein